MLYMCMVIINCHCSFIYCILAFMDYENKFIHFKKALGAGCPVLLLFLFFPIFSGLPIFSYILIPNPNSYIFQNAADNNEISRKNHGILV